MRVKQDAHNPEQMGKTKKKLKEMRHLKRWRTAISNSPCDAACDDLNLDCLMGDRLYK